MRASLRVTLEVFVVGVAFTAPEVRLVSKWVFDSSALCEDARTRGVACLVVHGTFLSGAGLLGASAITFSILAAGELHHHHHHLHHLHQRRCEAASGGGGGDGGGGGEAGGYQPLGGSAMIRE